MIFPRISFWHPGCPLAQKKTLAVCIQSTCTRQFHQILCFFLCKTEQQHEYVAECLLPHHGVSAKSSCRISMNCHDICIGTSFKLTNANVSCEFCKMSIFSGFQLVMGDPQPCCCFCERENPTSKWMMTGGSPMTQETSR